MAILEYNGNIQADIDAAHDFMSIVDTSIKNINAQLDILSDANVWSDANSATLISKAREITEAISKSNTDATSASESYLNEVENIISNAYSLGGN